MLPPPSLLKPLPARPLSCLLLPDPAGAAASVGVSGMPTDPIDFSVLASREPAGLRGVRPDLRPAAAPGCDPLWGSARWPFAAAAAACFAATTASAAEACSAALNASSLETSDCRCSFSCLKAVMRLLRAVTCSCWAPLMLEPAAACRSAQQSRQQAKFLTQSDIPQPVMTYKGHT